MRRLDRLWEQSNLKAEASGRRSLAMDEKKLTKKLRTTQKNTVRYRSYRTTEERAEVGGYSDVSRRTERSTNRAGQQSRIATHIRKDQMY
jgi:hypothetical protein